MAAADGSVPTTTDRQPGDPRPDSPVPTTDEVIERNVVSNAASSDFATVALSESQLERA